MSVNDPLARYFYEQECIKCTWSVRELRRQISTNLYFRVGISANPEEMLSLPSAQGHDTPTLQIRQPFTFEFLGLKALLFFHLKYYFSAMRIESHNAITIFALNSKRLSVLCGGKQTTFYYQCQWLME